MTFRDLTLLLLSDDWFIITLSGIFYYFLYVSQWTLSNWPLVQWIKECHRPSENHAYPSHLKFIDIVPNLYYKECPTQLGTHLLACDGCSALRLTHFPPVWRDAAVVCTTLRAFSVHCITSHLPADGSIVHIVHSENYIITLIINLLISFNYNF
jgi:hypothetical protein